MKLGLCAVVIGCLGAMNAVAQPAGGYPTKLVRMVFPAGPGSDLERVTRLVADKLAENWKQPVIVENRPGVGGNVAAALVARSEPDGHTLLVSPPAPIAIRAGPKKLDRVTSDRTAPVGSMFSRSRDDETTQMEPHSAVFKAKVVLAA